MWKKCHDMKLGEIRTVTNSIIIEKIIRVPGGWIYLYANSKGPTSTFVPFNEEFWK